MQWRFFCCLRNGKLFRLQRFPKNLRLTFSCRKELIVKKLTEEKAKDRYDPQIFEWLLQQLHLINQATVPVLHATRLKTIKPEFLHLYEQPIENDY